MLGKAQMMRIGGQAAAGAGAALSCAHQRFDAAVEAQSDGLESYRRWYDYSHARDRMFKATDTDCAPWHIVRSDDKRRARLNCIAAMLDLIPYKKMRGTKVKLPKRSSKGRYDDQASLRGRNFVAERY